MSTAAERRWFEAVASIECCVLCHRYGTQVAHRDEGKGMGLKNPAHLTAAICPECHRYYGEGKEASRDERRAAMDRAIVLTFDRLVRGGKVGLLK